MFKAIVLCGLFQRVTHILYILVLLHLRCH
nr:MAG TPA_asm: hypothetical protein [Bacteriophage sp.]